MKKIITFFTVAYLSTFLAVGQDKYFDFEKVDKVNFGTYTGKLDTIAKNPKPNEINSSTACAKYTRDPNVKYDNIRIYPINKLTGVEKFASHDGFPTKILMKLYTNAPVGTLIEIQLGNKITMDYPAGVNSQYQVYTNVQNQWEELVFIFSETPAGSAVDMNNVDMITLMFAPNTADASTYYFDDLMGPELTDELGQTKTEK